MLVNLRKIDERIQKLQEIRRIAADPEMVQMLLEFLDAPDADTPPPPAKPVESAATPAGTRLNETDDMLKRVLHGEMIR